MMIRGFTTMRCINRLFTYLLTAVTFSRPPPFFKLTNRSFRVESPYLWNHLSASFRQSCTTQSPSHSSHFIRPVHVRHHHFYRPQLLLFTAGTELTFSTSPSHHIDYWNLSSGLPSQTPDPISDFLRSSVCFIFFSHYFL